MAGSGPVTVDGLQENEKRTYTVPLTVLTSLFFMWGFITCMNDILIPHLMNVFSLGYTEGMLVQFVFFTAYAVMSIPSGNLVKRIGYKKGIIAGLGIAAMGTFLFYPAAEVHSYPFFLTAFFVLASGITLLQVSANPYVSILGPSETASSRLNLTQAFNSLGTTVAPFVGSALILAIVEQGISAAEEAAAVQNMYLGLTAILLALAGVIAFVKLPSIDTEKVSATVVGDHSASHQHTSAWNYSHLVLGAIGIFVYVGAEVSIGSFLVKFFALPEIVGMNESAAGKFMAYYWGGTMVGRFIGAAMMQKVKPGNILTFNAIIAAVLVVLTMMVTGKAAMYSILAVGLFNSIMFPTIFTLAIDKLGIHTPQGSGILCMAIVGGAIIPLFQGMIADSAIGLHHSFILPVFCYLYIVHYGLRGHWVR